MSVQTAGAAPLRASLPHLHVDDVLSQMDALAAEVATWLAQAEDARLRARHLGERLALARGQAEAPDSSPEARAAASARVAALTAEVAQAQQEAQGLGERAGQAQTALAGLQAEGLPLAQQQDLRQVLADLESERARLDGDLEAALYGAAVTRDEAGRDARGSALRRDQLTAGPRHAALLEAGFEATRPAPVRGADPELDGLARQAKAFVQRADGGPLAGPEFAQLQARFARAVADRHARGPVDVGELVAHVLHEAYAATTDDLRFYAYRVRFYTDLKSRLRAELSRARTFQSKHQSLRDGEMVLDGELTTYTFSGLPEMDADGVPRQREAEATGTARDAKALDAYIKDLEQQLSTVGDDAQLAQLTLQDITQKQQRTIQNISNLSKAMHETAMAIIRKIGS